MFTGEKPPLEELAHYGVKGMKRGVRKSRYDQESQHERVMREQGRSSGNIKDNPGEKKTPTAPIRVTKGLQKIQALKSQPVSQVSGSPEQKRATAVSKLQSGKPMSDQDILYLSPKDRKKVPKQRLAEFNRTMQNRYKQNPKDKEAYEYLFT